MGNEDAVCISECFWQVILKHRPACGVRAWLKQRPESRITEFLAQAGECFADSRWVMSEIIDDRDAVHCAPHFLAAAYALERGEGGANLVGGDAVVVGGRGSHRGVADVEIPRERDEKSLAEKLEARALGLVDDLANLVAAIRREADLHNWRRTFLSGIDAIWIVTVEQNHAFGWHDVQQAAEAGLDLIEVAVDVCMVELDVIHDDEFG